jgi:hypothetical protein
LRLQSIKTVVRSAGRSTDAGERIVIPKQRSVHPPLNSQ